MKNLSDEDIEKIDRIVNVYKRFKARISTIDAEGASLLTIAFIFDEHTDSRNK